MDRSERYWTGGVARERAEIRRRLVQLKAEGADLARVFERISWTPEEALGHFEELMDDLRLLKQDFQRAQTRG